MSSAICFLDTETTGLHPGRLIWELAAVRREPDGRESELLIQIDPIDLSNADPFALKINGFWTRSAVHGDPNFDQPIELSVLSEKVAAKCIRTFTHNAHVIGAVPNFDTESLDQMFRRAGILPTWHYHLIDVENLAVGYLQGINKTSRHNEDLLSMSNVVSLPWKSDELSTAIGVVPPTEEERHTAMGDVRWAMRTYDKIMS